MSVQAIQTQAGRNPRTAEEARAFVAHVEKLFTPWNIDALVEGFTQDCEVRFGNVQLRGRDALRAFFETRSARDPENPAPIHATALRRLTEPEIGVPRDRTVTPYGMMKTCCHTIPFPGFDKVTEKGWGGPLPI
jgi:hypothetical protein